MEGRGRGREGVGKQNRGETEKRVNDKKKKSMGEEGKV